MYIHISIYMSMCIVAVTIVEDLNTLSSQPRRAN